MINVGTAHIGEFGSREAIAQAKGEIVEALPADGTAVLNAGDDLVAAMATAPTPAVLTFGRGGDVVRARRRARRPRPARRSSSGTPGSGTRSRSGTRGLHQVENALAAAAMALAVGLPLAQVAAALSAAAGASPKRMERESTSAPTACS